MNYQEELLSLEELAESDAEGEETGEWDDETDPDVPTFTLHTHTAPASWLSYLINDDSSALDDSEVEAADAWLSSINLGSPTGTAQDDDGDDIESEFISEHHAFSFYPYAADCYSYTFISRDGDDYG